MDQSSALTSPESNTYSFPTVVSSASPDSFDLKYARQKVAGSTQPMVEHSLESLVALGIDSAAAQYLLDEYRAAGEGVYLVDPETGRSLFKITEADIEEAPLMLRESGKMVSPGQRIKPHVLSNLYFDLYTVKKEEENFFIAQTSRRDTTDLVLAEGDPSLWIYTKQGRRSIFQQIRDLCTLEYFCHKLHCEASAVPTAELLRAEYTVALVDTRTHNKFFDLRSAAPAALAANFANQLRDRPPFGLTEVRIHYLDYFDKYSVYVSLGIAPV